MFADYFDRKGRPITIEEVGRLYGQPGYKIVKQTRLDSGFLVSTVWLGLNHNYGDGPPLIFETMVFVNEPGADDVDMRRYSTEKEALEGHEELCDLYSNDD